MSFLSALGDIIEAFSETSTQASKPRSQQSQPLKQIPSEQLVALLKQGRRAEAVQLVGRAMQWPTSRAEKFVDDIQTTTLQPKATFYAKPTKSSTHIDSVVAEHQRAEAGGGASNLFSYLFRNKA